MSRWRRCLMLLCCLTLLAVATAGASDAPQVVRVGAFNYYPAIFQAMDGTVQGFYVDMLAEIGVQENLRFEHVPGSWSEGLERLRAGEIDLLTSVARTQDRAAFLDYGQVPLLTVWGELYVPQDSTLHSIQQVKGKRIALMRGDFNGQMFVELVEKFGFQCQFMEFADFDQVFEAVRQGQADGGVANAVFGAARQGDYGLKATGVIFNPFDIYFAVAKGRHGDLLAILDHYLQDWRGAEHSVYQQARLRWSRGPNPEAAALPVWVLQLAGGCGLLLLAAAGFILLLRRQVGRKTAALVQREARLRESSDMIHLLLNSTAEAIYGLDPAGNCTFCNTACVKMLGFDHPEQLVGKNMHHLIHHTHADGSPFAVQDCAIFKGFQLDTAMHVDKEVLWRADGSSFAAEYWSYPIRRDGQVLGAVVTFLDITERKRAEAALQQKNLEMEHFVYTVSHDLRSPLVTIKSFLGLLAQDLAANETAAVEADLGYLNAAAATMDSLLQGLLQLSRAGREQAPPVAIGWQQLLRQSLDALAGCLLEQAVEVRVAEEDVLLYGDSVRLGQICSNLIDNAVKYRGAQPLLLELGVEGQGRERVFFVRDNGMGIAAGDREKIFGLFEKLDRHSEGSGLGLALVKKIVESYQGRIWVDSAGPGTGSCFRFTLPQALETTAKGE